MTFTQQETFQLTNSAGDVLSLSGAGIYVVEHAGLGLVKATRATQQGPYQHGQSLVSARLNPRVVTMKMLISSEDDTAAWILVHSLEAMLNDIDDLLYLDVTLPSGEVRRLDVMPYDGIDLGRKATDPYGELEQVLQLIADDPTFYKPTIETVGFGLGGGAGAFVVPMVVPTAVGASAIDQTQGVAYVGSWLSYPIIRITGPITAAVITNVSTGDKLDFTGTTIAAANWYEIDCRYGYKTVKDSIGANQIAKLTSDSDLATFSLQPNPTVVGGNNSIRVQGTGVNTATAVDMTYYTRYIAA